MTSDRSGCICRSTPNDAWASRVLVSILWRQSAVSVNALLHTSPPLQLIRVCNATKQCITMTGNESGYCLCREVRAVSITEKIISPKCDKLSVAHSPQRGAAPGHNAACILTAICNTPKCGTPQDNSTSGNADSSPKWDQLPPLSTFTFPER